MDSRKEALKEVQKYDFALQEVALYLDGHPKNQKALEYYMYNRNLANKARCDYEKTYGPLTYYDVDNNKNWDWIEGPWPWEGNI